MTLIPARELADETTLEADLCIVGAGAAGIAMARELAGGRLRVAILAGGGEAFRHATQLLYHGRNVGRESFAPGKSRFRMLGGSTTRWSAQCRPLDTVDFEARPGLPHTGWPFDRRHLEPFYRRAATVCHLDDWRLWERGVVEPVRYRHGWPTDFAAAFGCELRAASNIRLLLDVHALELVAEGGRVVGVEATTGDGRHVHIAASCYALACGGIENARLLLASTRNAANGMGNDHDLVGRFFMDHPFFWGGELVLVRPEDAAALEVLEGYEGAGRVQRAHGAFALTEAARRAEGLNGAAVFFVRRAAHKTSATFLSAGGVALSRVGDVLSHRELPDGRLARNLRRLANRPGEAARSLAERIGGALAPRAVLAARFTYEALPNPHSRVMLDRRRRDRFGMPHVEVDWRLAEGDRRGPDRLRAELGRVLAEAGIGRLEFRAELASDGHPIGVDGGKHHMGTTRMHDDPRHGVVDADCRVHGIANLFVAGSSVFPTGGYVNPTLTLVALSLRLADHLKVVLGR
jgi:choline dehydrogenase-like flavoprotein